MPRQQTITIAILGGSPVAENALALLLEHSGYDTRIIQESPPSLADGLLDGVDVLEDMLDGVDGLLLSTGLCNDVRDAFPEHRAGQPYDGSDARPHALYGHRTGARREERTCGMVGTFGGSQAEAIEAVLTPVMSIREPQETC